MPCGEADLLGLDDVKNGESIRAVCGEGGGIEHHDVRAVGDGGVIGAAVGRRDALVRLLGRLERVQHAARRRIDLVGGMVGVAEGDDGVRLRLSRSVGEQHSGQQ